MRKKKTFTLEDTILHLESLEMLDMSYELKKYAEYHDEETGATQYNVWIIEYEEGQGIRHPETAIAFED